MKSKKEIQIRLELFKTIFNDLNDEQKKFIEQQINTLEWVLEWIKKI